MGTNLKKDLWVGKPLHRTTDVVNSSLRFVNNSLRLLFTTQEFAKCQKLIADLLKRGGLVERFGT